MTTKRTALPPAPSGSRTANLNVPRYGLGPAYSAAERTQQAPQQQTITAGELLARARANALNNRAEKAAATQLTVGGTNTLLKLVYGTVRIGGAIFCIGVRSDGHLIVGVAWCHGEVNAITTKWVNDESGLDGITVTDYRGTAGQTVDATIQTLYPSYASALPNICYSVFNIRPRKIQGFPRFAALIEGKKISTTSGGAKTYSNNPAYIIADFIENTTYGMGSTVDWASVATTAAKCAETVGGAEPRNLLNIALTTSQLGSQWLSTLADYARCFIVPEGSGYKLIPDTTGSSVYSFDATNIVADSLVLSRRRPSQQPNIIRVAYTDTSVVPWREAYYQTSAVSPRRVSEVSVPGITRYSEAVRYAIERLNEATLCDLYVSLDTFDAALALVVGDLFDVSHPLGLTSKVFRLTSIAQTSIGRWHIEGSEYDPAVYSGYVATAPTTPDTSLTIGPNSPPTITGGVLTEVRFQTENGLYLSRLQATWDEPTWPYTSGYKVSFAVSDNGGPDPEYSYTDIFITNETTAYSSPITVAAGSLAIVYVSIISVTGVVGTGTRVDLIGGIVGAAAINNKRLTANFSGTVAQKTFLQTNVANSASSVGVLPNGSGTASSVYTYNAADGANSSICQFGVSASTAYLGSAIAGTGSQLPLGLYVAGTLWAEGMTTGWRWKFSSKSGAPTTGDIASGYSMVWKDTGSGAVYLYVNDGGTLKKVQLT